MTDYSYDILSFLDDRDIEYQTSGKNVSKGWANISCIFCGENSNHLGISSTGGFHCWVCGKDGSFPELVMEIDQCSFYSAIKILEPYKLDFVEEKEEPKPTVSHIEFPKGMEPLTGLHRKYLIYRGFDPDELVKEYDLRACLHLGGDFAYRIIIPVVVNEQIVTFTSRDITNRLTKKQSKYKHLSNDKSILPIKDCLYNIDSVKDKCIIVEGVSDVWRIGAGSVALFGTEYTIRQLKLLFDKEIKEAYVMFDSDATKKAYRLGNILSTFVPKVELLVVSDGDPAEMSIPEAIKLRKEIGFEK